MNPRVDLFLFGENAESDAIGSGELVRSHTAEKVPLNAASAKTLNELAEQSQAEFVAFQDASIPIAADDIIQTAKRFDEQPQADVMQIIGRSVSDPFDVFQRLPREVAVLIRPPESVAVVLFRKSELKPNAPFLECTAPIWDQVIRSVFGGGSMMTLIASSSQEIMEERDSTDEELPSLAPKQPGRGMNWLLEHLQNVRPETLVSRITSPEDAIAIKAGLLQVHDYLEESHEVSQGIQGAGRHAAGDYWHGIMHRREPDDSNAKYWFRRVGGHPIFKDLADQAAGILHSCSSEEAEQWQTRCCPPDGWDPFAFIDFCSSCRSSKDPDLDGAARRLQWVEMLLLLEQTCRDAST